jgi:hypothetical protein
MTVAICQEMLQIIPSLEIQTQIKGNAIVRFEPKTKEIMIAEEG